MNSTYSIHSPIHQTAQRLQAPPLSEPNAVGNANQLARPEQEAQTQTNGQTLSPHHSPLQQQLIDQLSELSLCALRQAENQTQTFRMQESELPLPRHATDKVGPCEQYVGYLLPCAKDERWLNRSNPASVLDMILRENYPAYQLAKNDKNPESVAKIIFCFSLGKIIWPDVKNGRSGALRDIPDLFRQQPLFSWDTTVRAIEALTQARVDGIISAEEGERALTRLAAQIPPRDVTSLLNDGKLKIVSYRCAEKETDAAVPRIVRRIEVHPTTPDEQGLQVFQLYESSDHENDKEFMTAFYRYTDAQGWLREPETDPEPLEQQQLIDDREASLRHIEFEPSNLPVLTTNHVRQSHIWNLVLGMSSIRAMLNDATTADSQRAGLRENLSILQGRLTRYLQDNLGQMVPGEIAHVYSLLTTKVSTVTYARAIRALHQFATSLPAEEKQACLDLLCECTQALVKYHAERLAKGLPSLDLKTLNLVAEAMASGMQPA